LLEQKSINFNRTEHALILAELIEKSNISFQVLRGSMKAKELKEAMASIENTQVLIATGKYVGEGFDLAKLDTLFSGSSPLC